MRWLLLIAAAGLAAANVARAQTWRAAGAPPTTGYLISPGSADPGRGQPQAAAPMMVVALPSSSALPGAAPPPAAERLPAPLTVPYRMPSNAPPLVTPPAPAPLAYAPAPAMAEASPEAADGAVATPAPQMIGGFLAGSAGLLRGVDPNVRVPLFMRGPVAIGENESPRPQDRVFVTFNYFDNAIAFQPGAGTNFNVYRETFGFEKTFLGGDASIGLRAPVQQKDNITGLQGDGFGDLTIVSKFAILQDHATGDAVSGGLTITVPTGRDVILGTAGGGGQHFDEVLFQPWVGGVVNSDRLYAHGFASAVIPSDSRDAAFLTFDGGVGYKFNLCQDNFVTQIIPTVEYHAYVPINHNGIDTGGVLVMTNQHVVTSGVHFGLGCRSLLTIAAAVPLSGPRPYDFGWICQLNVRF